LMEKAITLRGGQLYAEKVSDTFEMPQESVNH
jgi:hypothetical protein